MNDKLKSIFGIKSVALISNKLYLCSQSSFVINIWVSVKFQFLYVLYFELKGGVVLYFCVLTDLHFVWAKILNYVVIFVNIFHSAVFVFYNC